MKIAVITPYYQESDEILIRCYESVNSQQVNNTDQITHIFVADGFNNPLIDNFKNTEHIIFKKSHNDAGATPRAIAAISAFSREYDYAAFLDVDNTYQTYHIKTMIKLMQISNAAIISATRNICKLNGEIMYVDDIESIGDQFCDTNCMFFNRTALSLLTYWITEPKYRLWSDRQFWNAVVSSGISRTHCNIPTVNYHSKWAWHYQHANQIPPIDSVWIASSSDGSLIHSKNI